MKDSLETLSKIQKVDAPEFLYTRILNAIDEKQTSNFISKSWIWVSAACLSFIVILNVFAFNSFESSSTMEDSFSSNTLNQLYDE